MGDTQSPMDGAFASNGMGGDPNAMGGDPNAMGGDPNAMGGDPNAMGGMDPNAMGGDPNAMGEDPMAGGQPPMEGGEGDDSTMSIINQLSAEDREAVRAYAESMLDKSSGNEENPQMMETYIFSKKQLQTIMETIGTMDDKTEEKPLNKKNGVTVSKKSPFNSPKFK